MKRLVPLLLLAACTSGGGGNPQEQACARQADDAPAVRELIIKAVGSQQQLLENQRKLREARQDATLACLRGRGLAPKGGVERPKP